MATIYSRSAMLIQGLLESTGGAAVQGLSNTVTQLITGNSSAGFSSNTLTDVAFVNSGSSITYVQLFDVAAISSVTLGTTTPTYTFTLPANTTGVFQVNDTFSNGIAVAATTTANGSTAPATAVNVGLAYL